MRNDSDDREGPLEIALVGDLSDSEGELTGKLLELPFGSECLIYFDSPGGNPYSAMSMMSLLMLRQMKATGIVTGECSSAALWPFAACQRRMVTAHSILLFHPMKWQSEENVGLAEAAEWARHFAHLERDMDVLLAKLLNYPEDKLAVWMSPGRFVSGQEMVDAGLAEMIDLLDPSTYASIQPKTAKVAGRGKKR